MHVAQFDRRLVERVLHRNADGLDRLEIAIGPHTENQQESVRRFDAEARSKPFESCPTKYCSGIEARSHAFCPKLMIPMDRGPWVVFTHSDIRWGELMRISITRCEYADRSAGESRPSP